MQNTETGDSIRTVETGHIGTREAARRLGVDPDVIRYHARHGRLGARRRLGRWLLDPAQVDEHAGQVA